MKNKLLKIIMTSSVLVSSITMAKPVFANELNDEIDEVEKEAKEHEEAASNLDSLMEDLTNEMTSTESALDQLITEIQETESFLDRTLEDLEKAQEEMITLESEIDILEQNIAERSDQLEEQARKVQINGNSTSYIDFILEAESLTDILARVDLVSKVVNTSSQMIGDQKRDKEMLVQKTEETERKVLQQNALAEELEEKSAELESKKISEEALVAQLKSEKTTVASEKEAFMKQRDDALNRVQKLEDNRELARLAATDAEENREESKRTKPSSSKITSTENNESNESSNTEKESSDTGRKEESSTEKEDSKPKPNPKPTPKPDPKPKPKPDPKPEKKPDPAPAPSGNVLSIADKYLGTPYLFGGSTTAAFDCSGYTSHVFSEADKNIPRSSGAQYANSTKVSNPQAGDLVFFGRTTVTHVGIYLGGGRFIGSQTSTGVAYARLDKGYWSNKVIGYGRY